MQFAFALSLAAFVGCTRRPSTEIVLRVDSDIGADLASVRVHLDRGDEASTFLDRSFVLRDGAFTLPGTLGIAPRDADDGRPLRVQLTAELADPSRSYTQRADVAFESGRVVVLDMFLARECEAANVRSACEEAGRTCSTGGTCVDVERPSLPMYVPDASVARDATTDAARDVAADSMDVYRANDVMEAAVANDGETDAIDVIDAAEACSLRAEICNGIDDNCDGQTDEDPASVSCNAANARSACVAGVCTVTQCTGTFSDCDGDAGNGCEMDLSSSRTNCGSCGHACDGAAICSGSTCQGITQITAGWSHSCVLRTSGDVWCWGRNEYGQLGDGSMQDRSTAVQVNGLTDAVEVSAGSFHTCARRRGGSVVCWGENQTGALGSGDALPHVEPTAVAGLMDAVAISAGYRHTCAARASGAVVCWGQNDQGQLGDGSLMEAVAPVEAVGIADALSVGAGNSHSCALRQGGGMACWGDNQTDALGDGSGNGQTTPVMVVGAAVSQRVEGGNAFTCSLTGQQAVECWGDDAYGQLGDGMMVPRAEPAVVDGLGAVWDLAVGSVGVCAVMVTGAVSCWGLNGSGQLGDGTIDNRSRPVAVAGLVDAVAVAMGLDHTCALRAGGQVVCWGQDDVGQVGDGATGAGVMRLVPTGVMGLP